MPNRFLKTGHHTPGTEVQTSFMKTSYFTYAIIIIVVAILALSFLPDENKTIEENPGEKIGENQSDMDNSPQNQSPKEEVNDDINSTFSSSPVCVDEARTAFGVEGREEDIKIEGLVKLPTFTYETFRRATRDSENKELDIIYLFRRQKTSPRIQPNCTAAHAPIEHTIQSDDGNWTVRIRAYVDKNKTADTTREVNVGEFKEISATDKCEEDVDIAQKAAEGQTCTQQIQEMTCPHDSGFVYTAKDGCEISALGQQNWTEQQ